jgi:hypothetical protein
MYAFVFDVLPIFMVLRAHIIAVLKTRYIWNVMKQQANVDVEPDFKAMIVAKVNFKKIKIKHKTRKIDYRATFLLNDSTKDKLYTILFLRPKETF